VVVYADDFETSVFCARYMRDFQGKCSVSIQCFNSVFHPVMALSVIIYLQFCESFLYVELKHPEIYTESFPCVPCRTTFHICIVHEHCSIVRVYLTCDILTQEII
jgi:hypothetical protein